MYFPANKFEIFSNGKDKFEALINDLKNAEKFIHLQYYIIDDDCIGRTIQQLLISKAKAGVKVRLIYDHVGSFHTKNRFFKEMQKAGVEALPFLKVTFPQFATRINWRNHRKLAIIDGKIGYIGGMNIADRYINGTSWGVWRDTHLRIIGPCIGGLQYSFAVDWNFMGQPLLDETIQVSEYDDNDEAGAMILTSGPTGQWSNIALLFEKAISTAKRRILIQTPYFLPTETLLTALQAAALAKIDVRIMIPRRSDSTILRHASFSYISECLKAGIKFYLFEEGMLHSKNVVVDDEFASTGSTNFDFRSFEHNFEGNIFVFNKAFNTKMTELFRNDMRQCTRITSSLWKNRPFHQRFMESTVRLLSPIL